ncbi:uncharacterized protein N0V96_000220 [Colletotrichum fioriniae]|uniref:uncharacterized protein n=1 Tax=Colletotrichum fioriniae TaxID=710243 RepID=UPI0032DAB93B|nr:hypothetical protein N0V96_000220 [Colletotrichum fioriniae]
MGNKQSTLQRRNTDNTEEHLVFDDYVTGPGRSQGPTGPMQEYAIPQSGEQFNFQFDRRTQNARQAARVIHRNERANVMGPANGRAANDPIQTRAAVRVAQVNGEEKIAVVGVMTHPDGDHAKLVRAPLEPLNREGRQELTRHTDERGRMRTFPPRGLDAKVIENVETRFANPHPATHPGMRV